MLQKLIKINCLSSVQQNISHNLYGLKDIQYEEEFIGKGAVGSVFKVINIDGKTQSGFLLKIISDKAFIEKSYETISILHEKLNNHQLSTGIPVFLEIPELNGLPFLAFKAEIESTNQNVAGYLMRDLSYYEFEDFGSENWNKEKYITDIGFEEKLYLCYQFARGINFMHQQKFVHSDIKDYSIFLNLRKPQLSIIDYDGGFNFDKQESAITIGAINSWLSSKWRKLISQGKSAKDVSTKERLNEENWNLASGLFQILIGIPPFYFLKSVEGNNIDNYLSKNKWPYITENSDAINQQNIGNHKAILEILETIGNEGFKPIIDIFIKVFNEGHSNEKKRHTPHQWETLLFEVTKKIIGKPLINDFSSNKATIYAKNEKVLFNWDTSFTDKVYLEDELQDPFVNFSEVTIPDAKEVSLKIVNDFGYSVKKIFIDTKKIQPKVISFNANIQKRVDLSPVILNWETENCSEVRIEKIGEHLTSQGSIEVNPTERTKYNLIAIGFFDQRTNAELEIEIESTKILAFNYEINIEKSIDNIDITWETSNAIEVEILPRIGKVELNGETSIGINDKTEFTIKAKGFFNETYKTIEAQPFPVPIIKGILIPTPILNMNTVIPSNLLIIPEVFNDYQSINFNNEIHYNEALPPFINFNEKIDIDNTIFDSKAQLKILNFFNNLYKKVTHQKN